MSVMDQVETDTIVLARYDADGNDVLAEYQDMEGLELGEQTDFVCSAVIKPNSGWSAYQYTGVTVIGDKTGRTRVISYRDAAPPARTYAYIPTYEAK